MSKCMATNFSHTKRPLNLLLETNAPTPQQSVVSNTQAMMRSAPAHNPKALPSPRKPPSPHMSQLTVPNPRTNPATIHARTQCPRPLLHVSPPHVGLSVRGPTGTQATNPLRMPSPTKKQKGMRARPRCCPQSVSALRRRRRMTHPRRLCVSLLVMGRRS